MWQIGSMKADEFRALGRFPASKGFKEEDSLRLVLCFLGLEDECSDMELDLRCYTKCVCRDSTAAGRRAEYEQFCRENCSCYPEKEE